MSHLQLSNTMKDQKVKRMTIFENAIVFELLKTNGNQFCRQCMDHFVPKFMFYNHLLPRCFLSVLQKQRRKEIDFHCE